MGFQRKIKAMMKRDSDSDWVREELLRHTCLQVSLGKPVYWYQSTFSGHIITVYQQNVSPILTLKIFIEGDRKFPYHSEIHSICIYKVHVTIDVGDFSTFLDFSGNSDGLYGVLFIVSDCSNSARMEDAKGAAEKFNDLNDCEIKEIMGHCGLDKIISQRVWKSFVLDAVMFPYFLGYKKNDIRKISVWKNFLYIDQQTKGIIEPGRLNSLCRKVQDLVMKYPAIP